MKQLFFATVSVLFMAPAFASTEILFNMDEQKGVVDLYTAPNTEIWEKTTALYQLCYKNADALVAADELMMLKDEGVLFDFDTEDYQSHEIDGAIIRVTVFNGKMLDDGIEEEEAYVTHDIAPCTF